eukprot:scaffold66905_cov21-Tisochrysis_lutea.AAC.1
MSSRRPLYIMPAVCLFVCCPGGLRASRLLCVHLSCASGLLCVCIRPAAHQACCPAHVILQLDFVKNPGLLRGAITSGASKDTALHWETLSRKLESHLQSAGGEAPEEVQDGTSAAAPNVPVPASPSAPLT